MSYHEKIKLILFNFGKQNSKFREVEKELPIDLQHKTDPKVRGIVYNPDVYYVRKKDGNYITFQVFDSQKDNNKEILGDIFCAVLTFPIKKGYFIVPTQTDYEKVDRFLKVSYSRLIKIFGVKKKWLPDLKLIKIEKNESKEQIEGNLLLQSRKDRW